MVILFYLFPCKTELPRVNYITSRTISAYDCHNFFKISFVLGIL